PILGAWIRERETTDHVTLYSQPLLLEDRYGRQPASLH
ncbi:unnamed protein product, partial [marine sediment metagenome]